MVEPKMPGVICRTSPLLGVYDEYHRRRKYALSLDHHSYPGMLHDIASYFDTTEIVQYEAQGEEKRVGGSYCTNKEENTQ